MSDKCTSMFPVPPTLYRKFYMRLFRSAVRSRYFAKAMLRFVSTVFQWKHPGLFIPLFLGMALAMFGIAQNAHSLRLVHLGFGLVYLFIVVALVWALGSWLTSRFLQDKNPYANRWDNLSVKVYRGWKWGVCGGIGVLFVLAVIVAALFHADRLSSVPVNAPDTQEKTSKVNQPKTNSEATATPCKYALEFSQAEIPSILGSPFGQRITVIPRKINDQVFPFVRFTATEHITGGEGLGVMVTPDTGDPQAAGISLASGHLGVMVEKDGSAELWLSDAQKFVHSKSVVVQLYGPKRFEVVCAEQPPIPPTQYITIPNAGPTKSPVPTPQPAATENAQGHRWEVQKHLGKAFADGQHLYNDKCIGPPEYRGGEISPELTKSISDWEADTLRVLAGEINPKVLTNWNNANMLSIDKSVDSHCMQFSLRLQAVQRILEKEFPGTP